MFDRFNRVNKLMTGFTGKTLKINFFNSYFTWPFVRYWTESQLYENN